MRLKRLSQTDVQVVRPTDPAIQNWIDKCSKTRTVRVQEVVNGRARTFERQIPGKIVAGTGLRQQHMVPRASCTNVPPLPSAWYDEKNDRTREYDPFGVYTKSGYVFLRDFYVKQLTEIKATGVITGGAGFVDQLLAAAALHLKLPLMIAVPMDTQMSMWDEAVQTIYVGQAKKADLVVLVSETSELLTPEGKVSKDKVAYAMNKRNRFMVAHAHEVLATWRGAGGGTKNCIADAVRMGKPVTDVYPQLMSHVGYTSTVKVRPAMDNLFGDAFARETLAEQVLTSYTFLCSTEAACKSSLTVKLNLRLSKLFHEYVIDGLNNVVSEEVAAYNKVLRELHPEPARAPREVQIKLNVEPLAS